MYIIPGLIIATIGLASAFMIQDPQSMRQLPYYDAYFTSIKMTSGTGDIELISGGTANTSLTIAVPSAPQGKECTIEATLKDENDNPLQNFDIDFYVCGTDCMDWIGTAKTDSNGVASLKYTFPRTVTYNVNAMFSGTTNYAQSSSENVDIILIDYTPYLLGGGNNRSSNHWDCRIHRLS